MANVVLDVTSFPTVKTITDLVRSDVRDDMGAYAQSAQAYQQMAQARSLRYWANQMKVAVKDRDTQTLRRYAQRLAMLDPDNEALHQADADLAGPRPGLWALRRLRTWGRFWRARWFLPVRQLGYTLQSAVPRWAWYASAAVLLLCCAVGAVRWRRRAHELGHTQMATAAALPAVQPLHGPAGRPAPSGVPPSTLASTASLLASAASTATPAAASGAVVDLRIAGGMAQVNVDGHPMGRTHHRIFKLAAGHHLFEVIRGGRASRRAIMVSTGDHISMRANPSRHQINVR